MEYLKEEEFLRRFFPMSRISKEHHQQSDISKLDADRLRDHFYELFNSYTKNTQHLSENVKNYIIKLVDGYVRDARLNSSGSQSSNLDAIILTEYESRLSALITHPDFIADKVSLQVMEKLADIEGFGLWKPNLYTYLGDRDGNPFKGINESPFDILSDYHLRKEFDIQRITKQIEGFRRIINSKKLWEGKSRQMKEFLFPSIAQVLKLLAEKYVKVFTNEILEFICTYRIELLKHSLLNDRYESIKAHYVNSFTSDKERLMLQARVKNDPISTLAKRIVELCPSLRTIDRFQAVVTREHYERQFLDQFLKPPILKVLEEYRKQKGFVELDILDKQVAMCDYFYGVFGKLMTNNKGDLSEEVKNTLVELVERYASMKQIGDKSRLSALITHPDFIVNKVSLQVMEKLADIQNYGLLNPHMYTFKDLSGGHLTHIINSECEYCKIGDELYQIGDYYLRDGFGKLQIEGFLMIIDSKKLWRSKNSEVKNLFYSIAEALEKLAKKYPMETFMPRIKLMQYSLLFGGDPIIKAHLFDTFKTENEIRWLNEIVKRYPPDKSPHLESIIKRCQEILKGEYNFMYVPMMDLSRVLPPSDYPGG